jgi:hypothetical protein
MCLIEDCKRTPPASQVRVDDPAMIVYSDSDGRVATFLLLDTRDDALILETKFLTVMMIE